MLETVNADADRVTRLITELLDVSRIEAGRIEVHRSWVDVGQRAEKIVAGRVAAGDPPEPLPDRGHRGLCPETRARRGQARPDSGQPRRERGPARVLVPLTIVIQPVDDLSARALNRAGNAGVVKRFRYWVMVFAGGFAGAPAVMVAVR